MLTVLFCMLTFDLTLLEIVQETDINHIVLVYIYSSIVLTVNATLTYLTWVFILCYTLTSLQYRRKYCVFYSTTFCLTPTYLLPSSY